VGLGFGVGRKVGVRDVGVRGIEIGRRRKEGCNIYGQPVWPASLTVPLYTHTHTLLHLHTWTFPPCQALCVNTSPSASSGPHTKPLHTRSLVTVRCFTVHHRLRPPSDTPLILLPPAAVGTPAPPPVGRDRGRRRRRRRRRARWRTARASMKRREESQSR
jgi:hypothetical protein